jgi:hypothetical protein
MDKQIIRDSYPRRLLFIRFSFSRHSAIADSQEPIAKLFKFISLFSLQHWILEAHVSMQLQ